MWNLLWQTMRLQIKQSFARPMYRFCLLVGPVMNTLFLYEEFLYSGEQNLMQYVTVSAGLMGLWSCICFSSVGDINRERFTGTLPMIFVAPAGFGNIILGKVLGNTFLSLFSFMITYFMTAFLSKAFFGVEQPFYVAITFFVMIVCFIMISVCFSYIMMISRKTELYMNLLEIPLVLLCGFTFPVEMLPKWVQKISNIIPATWTVKMFRLSISYGKNVSKMQQKEFLNCLLILIIELVIMSIFTYYLMRIMDKMVRKNASLEVA